MRTKLMASVAVALLGMGVTAQASQTPFHAVVVGASVMTGVPAGSNDILNVGQGSAATGDDPANSDASTDRYIDAYSFDNGSFQQTVDPTRGEELAALAWAVQIHAATPTVQSYVNSVAAAIISDVNTNYGGDYSGDELWGLTRAAQVGNAGAAAAVTTYFNSTVTGGAIAGKANTVVGGSVGDNVSNRGTIDATGIWSLSHFVLAANTIGTTSGSDKTAWRTSLETALGNYNTASNGDGFYSTTTALASALWALKTAGSTGTTGNTNGGNAAFANQSLSSLKDLLINTSNLSDTNDLWDNTNKVFYSDFNHSSSGSTEDMAYAILALKAMATTANDFATIKTLEAILANSVDPIKGTPQFLNGTGGYQAAYSGAALQALPEPATLSLLALGGLGLLARRRRQS